jgi:hypothetical protein
MTEYLFISKTDFEGRAQISAYVPEKVLTTAILNAQRFYLRLIVGSAYYAGLQQRYQAGTQTPDDISLVQAATPMLVYRSASYYYVQSGFVDTQSGLRVNLDDHSQPLSSTQLTSMVKQTESMAAEEQKGFEAWLRTNSDSYPEIRAAASHNSFLSFAAAGAAKRNEDKFRNNRAK